MDAMRIRKEVFGVDHPETAASFRNIGVVMEKQGRLMEAMEMFEVAMEHFKRVFGETHERVAMCRRDMLGVLEKQAKK
jgi:Tfp pilus assembly protein PilF